MKKVYVWLASLFVSFALVSMGVMASAESVAQAPADVISEDVSFANTDSGLTLSGILYTPAEMTRDALNPAIIVTGPMLSVKEQAQSVYAQRLATEGYVTLVFDYSTFGESEGEPRSLEVPDLKASDIRSAVTFLQGLSYVDDERIGGVGICGSGSYMPYAALSEPRIKAVASIVPATTMDSFIYLPVEQAENERDAYEAGTLDAPTYIDLMPRAYAEGAAYYYNEERGWRENWSNLAVGWSELSWLDFHPAEFIRDLEQPLLVITAENAWSRSGAEAMYENAPGEKVFSLIPDAGHFDVYDLEPYVTEATGELVAFFEEQL